MPDAPVIPSPAQTVAAHFAENAADLSDIPPMQRQEAKPVDKQQEQRQEVKSSDKKEPAKSVSSALEGLSDDPQKQEPKKEEGAPEPERKKGENDSSFIKRLKAERAELIRERDQAKQEADKRKGLDPEQLTALQKELQERDKLIEMTAFEKSKAYKNDFAAPLDKAVKTAQEFIEFNTDEKGVYEKALSLKGKERMDFLKANLESAAPSAFDKIAAVEERIAARDAAVAEHAENGTKWQEQQAQEETRKVLEAFDSQKETISKKLSVFRGDQAESLESQARALLTGDAPAEDIIAAARLAVACPYYISVARDAQAKLAVYEAREAERNKTTPRMEGRGADRGGDAPAKIEPGKVPTIKEFSKGAFVPA